VTAGPDWAAIINAIDTRLPEPPLHPAVPVPPVGDWQLWQDASTGVRYRVWTLDGQDRPESWEVLA